MAGVTNGFFDGCMKKIGPWKHSADHTLKVMKNLSILNDDNHDVPPYESLYLVLNEIGMVVSPHVIFERIFFWLAVQKDNKLVQWAQKQRRTV